MILSNIYPVDTGRKLNVQKTFRRRPGRLLNISYTFNLCPVFNGYNRFFGKSKYGLNPLPISVKMIMIDIYQGPKYTSDNLSSINIPWSIYPNPKKQESFLSSVRWFLAKLSSRLNHLKKVNIKQKSRNLQLPLFILNSSIKL